MNRTSILLMLLGLCFACSLNAQETDKLADYLKSENITAQKTEEGLYYTFEEKGKGQQPKVGDYIKVLYTGRLLDGKVFDATETEPFVFQLGYRQVIRGWDIGLQKFRVGSKGQLFVPATLAYGKRGAGEMIPPNSPLVFDIEIVDILSYEEYDKYMVELERKERIAYEAHVKKQFVKDQNLINDYAIGNKMKTKRTQSDVNYVLTKQGKGDLAKAGDKLIVHYEGRLLDDSVFDSNFDKEPFTFTLGVGKVIKGWDDGLKQFKKGGEGWLLIPSKYAYGPRAIKEDDIAIPENAVLIFKIKVIDIVPSSTVRPGAANAVSDDDKSGKKKKKRKKRKKG